MILPDGGRIHYNRISPGTSHNDAVYEHKSSTTKYYGSTIRRGAGACYWDLKLTDGSEICFPESMNSTVARHAAAVSMSDRYGNTLTFTRTNNNRTRITSPSGRTVDLQYDSANRITQATDNLRRMVFNAKGYITSVTEALGLPEQQVTSYEYEPTTNLLLSVTDPLGRKTAYAYDTNGNMTRQTFLAGTPNAISTETTYTADYSKILTFKDLTGRTITRTYDNAGNLVQTADAQGVLFKGSYNGSGQLVRSEDALGNATTYQYDGFDLSQVTDPLGRVSSMVTDSAGRIIEAVTPSGIRSSVDLDALNRAVTVRDGLGNATAMEFDGNGNRTLVRDAKGDAHNFAFDRRNAVTQQTNPVNQSDMTEYDQSHNVKKSTDRKGQATQFAYDGLNRLTSITYADQSTTAYTYDQGNRVTQVADSANGTITRTYDGLNNVTSETTPNGSVSYTYYPDGRRQTMSVTGQPTLTYTYTARNQMAGISQAADAMNGNQVRNLTFDYDAVGRRMQTTYFNGMVRQNTFDSAGQLTSIVYKAADGSVVGDLTYQYDIDGRIIEKDGSLAQSAQSAELVDATYDEAAKLTSANGAALTYDANGNLTADATMSYIWNARNQLVEMRTSQGTLIGQFSYDALGRRVQKTVNGVTSKYVYDKLDAVQEKDGNSQIQAVYVMGALDEPLQRIAMSGASPRIDTYLSDHIGSVLALKDMNEATTVAYSYDEYGNSQASAADANPFQYTGRENDGTGLYYYRERYYSPTLRRFVQSDPIGLRGGINEYVYVVGNPVRYRDPRGLNPVAGAIEGAEIGTAILPGWGTVVGGIVGAGIGLWIADTTYDALKGAPMPADNYEPGFVDAIRGAKDWGKRNNVPNAVDIFHEIKKGDRGRPGSKAGDNCSVNPDTGDVNNGVGEHIGNLGDGP